MATITKPDLSVSTHLFRNQATLVANCEVEFTEVEVTAINVLAARFTVDCRVLNREVRYEDTVFRYDEHGIPRLGRNVSANEYVEFRADATMSELHEHIMTADQLVAEFTLTNVETGAQDVKRSDVVTVNLGG